MTFIFAGIVFGIAGWCFFLLSRGKEKAAASAAARHSEAALTLRGEKVQVENSLKVAKEEILTLTDLWLEVPEDIRAQAEATVAARKPVKVEPTEEEIRAARVAALFESEEEFDDGVEDLSAKVARALREAGEGK